MVKEVRLELRVDRPLTLEPGVYAVSLDDVDDSGPQIVYRTSLRLVNGPDGPAPKRLDGGDRTSGPASRRLGP